MSDLPEARRVVWEKAGFSTSAVDPPDALDLSPSIDILTLAFATLAREARAASAAFAAFVERYNALEAEFRELQARERREHKPVAGRIRFVPGQPVRGVVSFTDPPDR